MNVHGAILAEVNYDRLLWAKENPIRVIASFKNSFGLDDIWDKSTCIKEENSYWESWLEMCISSAMFISENQTTSFAK